MSNPIPGDDALNARTDDIRLRLANPTSIPRAALLHYAECLLAHVTMLRAAPVTADVAADKFQQLAGRGLHELRIDEMREYLVYIGCSFGPSSDEFVAAADWFASELERKTNDERVIAVAFQRFRESVAAGAPAETAKAVELIGVAEQIKQGAGFWHSCSGCHDTEDGHPVGNYAYSNEMQCALGNGCSECGGLGACWDNNDYSEAAGDFLNATTAPATAPDVAKDAARLALQKIIDCVPAHNSECGGFFFEHYGPNGEYLGAQ